MLYLGLDECTVLDEFHRLVRRQARRLQDFLPRTLFRYELVLYDVLDLRDEEALAAVGLNPGDIKADDLAACQAVGDAAHYAGREGILAGSATGMERYSR